MDDETTTAEATDPNAEMELDLGLGDGVPDAEPVKEEPSAEDEKAPEAKAKDEKPAGFDADRFAEALAKHLKPSESKAKEEPVAEELDFIDELEKAEGVDLSKHGGPLVKAMNERHKQTMSIMETMAQRLVASEKQVKALLERDAVMRLKEEAGDSSIVEELKSESAKAASELLGFPEGYTPKNDEDGRAWVRVANAHYAKLLAAKKASKAPEKKASTSPVGKTSTPAKPSGSKLEQAAAAIGEIDFG